METQALESWTFDRALQLTLTEIWAEQHLLVSVGVLDDMLARFIDSQWFSHGGRATAAQRFCALGGASVATARGCGVHLTMAGIEHTVLAKHHDYGTANIARFGRQGILVRLSDKLARLTTLVEHPGAPRVAESVADTFVDTVGYCALGMLWERGQYLLPTAPA